MFDIDSLFPSVKFALAAPKILYLGTHKNNFQCPFENAFNKKENQDLEIMGTITSSVLKLSLSYSEKYLLAESRRIG